MVQFGSLSLWERVGEGLSANCNHNVAAGFSPQSVQGFFAASTSFKNQLVVPLDNGLKPGELFRVCRAKPSPPTLSQRERESNCTTTQPDREGGLHYSAFLSPPSRSGYCPVVSPLHEIKTVRDSQSGGLPYIPAALLALNCRDSRENC